MFDVYGHWLYQTGKAFKRLVTNRKRGLGKVTFLHLSVILFTEEGSAPRGVCIHGGRGQTPPWDTMGYGQRVTSMHPTEMHSCYHPQTKLRKGNVFTPVCDSVHMGEVYTSLDTPPTWTHIHTHPGQTPPGHTHTHGDTLDTPSRDGHCSGRHASY